MVARIEYLSKGEVTRSTLLHCGAPLEIISTSLNIHNRPGAYIIQDVGGVATSIQERAGELSEELSPATRQILMEPGESSRLRLNQDSTEEILVTHLGAPVPQLTDITPQLS